MINNNKIIQQLSVQQLNDGMPFSQRAMQKFVVVHISSDHSLFQVYLLVIANNAAINSDEYCFKEEEEKMAEIKSISKYYPQLLLR